MQPPERGFQEGFSQERKGRARRAHCGRLLSFIRAVLKRGVGWWGHESSRHECPSLQSLPCRRAGLCSRSTVQVNCECVCCVGLDLILPTRPGEEGIYLSLCATCGITGRLILYMLLAPTGVNKKDYSLGVV